MDELFNLFQAYQLKIITKQIKTDKYVDAYCKRYKIPKELDTRMVSMFRGFVGAYLMLQEQEKKNE